VVVNSVRSHKNIVFVNPWSGVCGPNIGMLQYGIEALSRGHSVHVVGRAVDETLKDLEAAGAHIRVDPRLSLFPRSQGLGPMASHAADAIASTLALRRVARECAADLICVNAENLLLQPWAARMCQCPVVVVVHGARFTKLGVSGRVYFGVQKRSGAKYIAVSRIIGQGLLGLGVPADRVAVVYNGVDLAQCHPMPRDVAFRKELGIQDDAFVVVTVSHVVPRKGIHHLIEIAAIARRGIPNLVCLVVGPHDPAVKEYDRSLGDRVEALGLNECVRFLGERHDVHRILNAADVMVHPSETESFGRVIAEAMACGRAVLGFDVDAVPELIDDGRNGFVIAPFNIASAADAVIRLARDEGLRERLGQAGREKAEKLYDAVANAKAAVDYLEQAAASRNVGRVAGE
jgi:glycosyltransferase involved in cell wall biosynthesis